MRTALEARQVALNTHTNNPSWCQLVTRGYYDAPSAGDFDGDGASDAEDGWKKEPQSARHFDRTGSSGYPASFLGGSDDKGHRAIFVSPGVIRSTDFDGNTKRYRAGVVGNGTVAQVEAAMGVEYVGWSTTIDGVPIPQPKPLTKGWAVEKAERLISHARSEPGTLRASLLERISKLIARIPKDR